MRVVAFMPAKSSSERLPNKNLMVLDGEILFRRKLRQLLACRFIDDVYLDTDSDEIAAMADDLPVKRIVRPAALATNETDGHGLFAFECQQAGDADIYIQALCTAPFIDEAALKRAFGQLQADLLADSLVAVRSQKQYCWSEGRPLYGDGRVPNSIDLPATTVEAMSLYMVRRGAEGPPPHRRFGVRPVMFEVSETEAVDINTIEDVGAATVTAAGLRAAETAEFNFLRRHFSTALLADIGKDLGVNFVLPPEVRQHSPHRMLGRARTLELRAAVGGGDDWKGVYRALDSYASVRPGDVILVSNPVAERAYFGELNANLALRAGAVGAVIDGCTRDIREVRNLEFACYARAITPRDIKHEGSMRRMNHPLTIGDVHIENDDIVMGDEDGVVVVAGRLWPEVKQAAIRGLDREARIKIQILQGIGAREILSVNGEF